MNTHLEVAMEAPAMNYQAMQTTELLGVLDAVDDPVSKPSCQLPAFRAFGVGGILVCRHREASCGREDPWAA